MRKLRTFTLALAVPALLALLALSACTGTFQEGTPLVLLVANGGEDSGSQVLAFLVEPPGPASPREVTPLGGGDLAPDLTLPLRAWDWVDRDPLAAGGGTARTQLVVLATRQAPAQNQRSARLHRYDVAGFDPDAPSLTRPDPAPLQLVNAGAWNDAAFPVADGLQSPEDGVCLVDVAVSSQGRYVALLDRRSACLSGDVSVGVHVIDLLARELVWSSTPDDVAPARLVLDQGSDSLDVWTRTAGGYAWRQLDLASSELGPEVRRVSGNALVDITQAAEERWVLLDARLRVVSGESDGAPGEESASGATRRLVPTAPRLPAVIIGTNLWVHPGPNRSAMSPFPRAYVDGATDVSDQLTYLLRPGAIDTLDLLVLNPEEPLSRVISPVYRDAIADAVLDSPRRVTWFRPRPLMNP